MARGQWKAIATLFDGLVSDFIQYLFLYYAIMAVVLSGL